MNELVTLGYSEPISAQAMLDRYAEIRARLRGKPVQEPMPVPEPVVIEAPAKPLPPIVSIYGRVQHPLDAKVYEYAGDVGPRLYVSERELEAPVVRPQFSPRSIVRQVADEFGVTFDDILGPRRGKNLVDARYEAIWRVSREYKVWSLPQIGRFFHRDHSTILYCLNKMRGLKEASK